MSVPFWDKLPRKIPLSVVLVIVFAALSVLGVGLTGYLSFRNGQRAVNDVAHQLQEEISRRIIGHLRTFLKTPLEINQLNVDILSRGVIAAEDAPALEHHFWEQTHVFNSVSSIYFGNTLGGLVDAGREGTQGFLYVISTDGFVRGTFKKYSTGRHGQRASLLATVPDFDARLRSWYIKAVHKGDAVWSEPYVLFTGQDMAIACSQPVYNKQNRVLGVVSVDLFLSDLSRFLQNMAIGKTGQAFIMERSGLLIASSSKEKPYVTSGKKKKWRRLYAKNSTIPLIRHAAEILDGRFGSYQHILKTRQLKFKINGEGQFLQVSPIGSEEGLEWLSVVVIPEADFMAHIYANNRATGLLVFVTFLMAVFLAVFTTRKVIAPISQLSEFADALSEGEWAQAVRHDSRILEISTLTKSLNHMARQLQQMFEDLVKENAERKKAEESLRESRENLRITLDSIGDAVITTDTGGKVTGMNPTAETLTGWMRTEAFGKSLSEVFHIINAQTRLPVENPVEKVLRVEKVIGLANHTVLVSKGGTEYQIADSGAPIQDKTGKITGVVLVFRDVTEQLKAEKELLKAKKLESVGVLAGGIAHDFNNLLTGLFGNIEMAKMFLTTDHKSLKYLTSAGQSMERAKNLTNQLLTFSKGGEPIKNTLSIGEVILEAAQFSMHGSKAKLQNNIASDLWLVEADKGQVSQVINNLVINAQQAMPTGGTITIAAENVIISMDRYVKIVVHDEGAGIAPQNLDKIFDPYFSTKQFGSGLGLASTHSIIRKHNGQITVHSQPNQGTTFTIFLPAAAKDAEKTIGKLSKDTPIASVSSARILVMDDEEDVREVIGTMLEAMGYTVEFSTDGQEAVEKYHLAYKNGMAYDIVITDLTIPGGMGGQKVAQELLRVNPQAKIIVSSGYTTDAVMANYEEYGFKGIVAKPYYFKDLQKEIQRVLKLL